MKKWTSRQLGRRPVRGLLAGLLITMIFTMGFTACGATKLDSAFNEDDLKRANQKIIDMVNQKDHAGLRAACTETLAQALTDDLLAKVETETIIPAGKFKGLKEISINGVNDSKTNQPWALIVTKAEYESKSLIYTITFDKNMKLVGVYVK